jgi:phage terminase large subunit
MSFVRTTAINKIGRMSSRKKIIQGGTSAGKTFGVLPILIDIALKYPNKEISVVAESIPHLRRGALKDFLKIMRLTLRFREEEYNKSLLRYEFANGSFIEFFSANEESKLRGARRNILYINEANLITFDSYYQLAIRTDEDIYLDFNPTQPFWVHEEVVPEEDSEIIVLTYRDNEALSETIVKDIEKAREKARKSSYWSNWWKVYGLGQIGSLQGVVFENWSQIKEVPKDAKLLGVGLDFGYTNDPTGIVSLYSYDGELIVDELLYRTGMRNSDLADFLKRSTPPGTLVIGDSAEPKSIDEIFDKGINIFGATKGKDSIQFSVQLLQDYRIRVTERSVNLIKELRGYIWETDRTGKKGQRPDTNCPDHLIDALRYIAVRTLNQRDVDYSIY